MTQPPNFAAKDILKKYSRQIESQLNNSQSSIIKPITAEEVSNDYVRFKEEEIPELNKYEKWAKSLGSLFSIKIAEKDRVRIQKYLDTAYLDVTVSQAVTLSLVSFLGIFFITILTYLGLYFITGEIMSSNQAIIFVLGMMISLFVMYYSYGMPQRLANAWRLRASSEMVPAILYMVVYMKHTSNLERAIRFASQHLQGPLSLDFKKVIYDVEIGKYPTVKQSIEAYLEKWREDSPEFIEAFHLIESSLFEPYENRRIEILEKSLQVILDGVYEKMLKYSREIRTPLTNLYMLGIILPTLGLAMLPLASTLLGGIFEWPHVFLLFNIIVPFMVFYLVNEVLLKRPSGYGETSSIEINPEYKEYKSKKPWLIAGLIAFPFIIIGLLPFIFQIQWGLSQNQIEQGLNIFSLKTDYTFEEIGLPLGQEKIFNFQKVEGKIKGPFGTIAILLSLFIPFSVGIFFGIVYSRKTKNIIKTRTSSKKLEKEFANSLFQLGNRIGDGIPAEIAFGKVAESTQGQMTYNFFSIVNQNIQQGGMSLESAIFDKNRGAIVFYPSPLISTSMRILVESVKKGLQVAALSLMAISEYVKNIEKINQRLQDLLAEIVSDMKSNMTFLAPLLAGIVVGLSSMITFILIKLSSAETEFGQSGVSGLESIMGFFKIFDYKAMIPSYYIQISIGLYIIEIIFILTYALVTVDSGKDSVKEKYETAKNIKRGLLLYLITALVSATALTLLGTIVLQGLFTG